MARQNPSEIATPANKWDNLTEIGRGHVLSLDKHEGRYLVVNRKEVPIGTVQAFDIVDEDGTEYRLKVLDMGGYHFDMTRGHDTAAVKAVSAIDDVQDFEVIDHDQEWLEQYFAEKFDHFSAEGA